MKLKIAILTLISSLLLTTVLLTEAIGYYFTKQSVEDLEKQYLQAVSEGVAKGVDAVINLAFPLLSSIEVPAGLSREIGTAEKSMIHDFHSHMKTVHELTYLNYGDQKNGHYVAIRRSLDGRLIFNRAHPEVDSGHEFEWLISELGDLSDLPKPATPPYDPRVRDWYLQALTKGYAWTKPYDFFSGGGKGISASLPIYNQDRSVKGVMSLAVSLDNLTQFLMSMRKESKSQIYVLLNDGTLVAGSSTETNEPNHFFALNLAREKIGSAGLDSIQSGVRVVTQAVDQSNYVVNFSPLRRHGGLNWLIAVVMPESSYLGLVTQNTTIALSLGLVALIIALSLGFFISDRISTPLAKISSDLENVARFDLSNNQKISSYIREVSIVADSVAKMKAGLRSFSRYVPHEEVRKVIISGNDTTLGGEIRQLTLHFSDLANFSTFCEGLSPDEVVRNLAEYLEVLSDILHANEATIAQYTGDGVFAFFNAPLLDPQHPEHAVKSALLIKEKLDQINLNRSQNKLFEFKNRIGLHTAEVVVGNIGTEKKLAYSAIGDGVNLASRLEGLNKVYGTTILASKDLFDLVSDKYLWRKLDRVAVVGRSEATAVYEPICELSKATDVQIQAVREYESALNIYFKAEFEIAKNIFSELTDQAARLMTERCNYFIANPPAAGWSGVFSAKHK